MPHTQHRRRPLRLGHPAAPQRLAGLLLLTACLTLLWACLSQPLNLGSPTPDQGAEGGSSSLEGGVPLLLGQMTIAGCQTLTFPGGEALCVGVAPLKVRLVLIDAGVTTHRWQLTSLTQPGDGGTGDGGPGTGNLLDDVQSRLREPEVLLQQPGTYDVALGVLGPGGTASASGQIVVQPVELGGRCARDGHCAQGLKCLCGADQPLVQKGLSWVGGRSHWRNAEVLHFQMPSEPTQRFAPMVNIQQFYVEEYAHQAALKQDAPVEVLWGSTVVAVRQVTVDGSQHGAGGVAGGVVGAVAGSSIGGRRDAVVGGVLGAVAGAVKAERLVLLTDVDLLGALARDSNGANSLPMDFGGEAGRELAIRFALNVAMYVLSSNYKDDQVHAEHIMRRRGPK